jgi:anti-anti-sigma factor
MNTDGMRSSVEPGDLLDHLAAAARASASPSEPFEQAIATIVIEAACALCADRAAVWLERDDAVEVVATTGLRPTTVDRFQRLVLRPGTRGEEAFRSDTPIVWCSHDDAQAQFPMVAVASFGSGLAVPISRVGDCSGVLFVGWREEHHPIGHADLTFLEIMARCCAFAVERNDLERERHTVIGVAHENMAMGDGLIAVRASVEDGNVVVSIAGAIDICNVVAFEAALRSIAHDDNVRSLVVDLAAVSFLSISGARALLEFRERAAKNRKAVAVRHASPSVARVLETFGLVV